MNKRDEKQKILIVDDDKDMAIFLSSLMEANGYIPIVAKSRSQGMEKAKDENPACVLLNFMMAGEEGFCMYKYIKADKDLEHLPVIIISSIPGELFMRCRMQNVITDDFMMKEPEACLNIPFETEELMRKIKSIIKKKTKASQKEALKKIKNNSTT